MNRVSLEEIIAVYQKTASVWKTGRDLGIAGQDVHRRLRAAGHPMVHRSWDDEEVAVLLAMASSVRIGEIADRLGRSYAAVACKLSELGAGVRFGNRQVRVPRGAGYDKVAMTKHIEALVRSELPVTRYCRSHHLEVETFMWRWQELELKSFEVWSELHGGEAKTCTYCARPFYPMNGKQMYCNRRCAGQARVDRAYFGGKRNTAIGLAEGICQMCGKRKVKGLSAHHMLGKENDPEDDFLIALCPGCHKAVTYMASRTWADDPISWESFIGLVATRRRGAQALDMEVNTYVEIKWNAVDEEADIE